LYMSVLKTMYYVHVWNKMCSCSWKYVSRGNGTCHCNTHLPCYM